MKHWLSQTVIGLLALLTLATFGTLGCGDEPDPCNGLANTCTREGARRCSGDSDAILTCQPNADGCMIWSAVTTCGMLQACQEEEAQVTCTCLNTCEPEGTRRCADDLVEVCVADADGCLDWEEDIDCTDAEQVCTDLDEDARCVTPCEDHCPSLGATQCDPTGLTIQTCQEEATGCLAWIDTTFCEESERVCSDLEEPVVCAEPCTDDCEVEDDTQCDTSDLIVQRCTLEEDGCFAWIDAVDCASSSPAQVCEEADGSATCVTP